MLDLSPSLLQVNGIRMNVVDTGVRDGYPVILLHGFPDFWYSWRFQIQPLVDAGYRVIAPDLRGYNLTDKHGPYDLRTLVSDVICLQQELGLQKSIIVGHDWGGIVAYALAAWFPERVDKLVIANAPHINAYQDAIIRHPIQAWKSWYALFFQIPIVPEWILSLDGYNALRIGLLSIDEQNVTEKDIEMYRQAWSQPGALPAMLGWYRSAFRTRLFTRKAFGIFRIQNPTLVVWGVKDPALDQRVNDTLPLYVDHLQFHPIGDSNHWVQIDQWKQFNQAMLDFLVSS